MPLSPMEIHAAALQAAATIQAGRFFENYILHGTWSEDAP